MMEGLTAVGAESKTAMIDATYLKVHRRKRPRTNGAPSSLSAPDGQTLTIEPLGLPAVDGDAIAAEQDVYARVFHGNHQDLTAELAGAEFDPVFLGGGLGGQVDRPELEAIQEPAVRRRTGACAGVATRY